MSELFRNPVNWTISAPNKAFPGSGLSASATWNGKDDNGNVALPGTYTATLSANVPGGVCTDTKSVSITIPDTCNLSVTDFKSSSPTINPGADQTVEISAKFPAPLCANKYWNLQIAGKNYSKVFSGKGNDFKEIWDAKDGFGEPLEPGDYKAILDVHTDNPNCKVRQEITITVIDTNSCSLKKRSFFSTVNITNGALGQDFFLFSTKGGSLATSLSLSYYSINKPASLGKGWNHSYDMTVTENESGSVVLREGDSKQLYQLSGGVYTAQGGDTSTLVKNGDGTYTITSKDGMTKNFNLAGQIASMFDRYGNAMTFTYVNGNLDRIADAGARTTSFAYDANNRLANITDPAGRNYIFTYTGNNLTAVTWPDGSFWQFAYDAAGYMTSKTDPSGNVTTYLYDGNHRIIQGTNPAGQTRGVGYPQPTTDAIKSSSFTEKDGGVWNYTYDSQNGLLTQKADPLGNVTSYTYDANRNMIRETAPDGSFTSYTYDAAGNMLTITDALGKTTTYTYNSLGQVTSVTDPLGRTTTSTYDANCNLTRTVDPLGATTIYAYDARGNMTGVTNALNRTSTFTFNAANNMISSTDPAGTTTTFTYDAMGNMLTQTNALGNVTSFEYDIRNRLVKSTDPLGNVTTYAYDLNGNKTSQTDANGNVTRYEYNSQGHLVKTIDALGNATTYAYGATGCTSCGGSTDKLTSLTDAKGQTTIYQYDALGRLLLETDPLAKSTGFAYDTAGNLTIRTDANSAAITYNYDALKRLISKGYPDGSTESYTYDAAGRILTATNANVAYTYAYDAAGRVASVTDSRGYAVAYEYNLLGNRTKMTLQPGSAEERVTTYIYDKAGRMQTITSPAGTFTYGYDALGRRTSLAYPNQITTSYSYDNAGRLTTLSHGAIASFSYSLDNVGNRTGKTATDAEQYLYDAIYRLLTVTSTKPEAFSFDPVGNRQTGPGAKDTAYLHNAGNQLLQGRRLQYGYDNNGNQTTKTVPNATDKSWIQTWDYENRLVKVERTKGAEKRTVSFSYDPMGRRIGKQMIIAIDGVARTSTYAYVYDNDNIAMEILTDDSGVAKTYYTHGAGVDEHLALERGGSSYYYHADGLGSVVSITDQGRNVVQIYEYDSFGMVRPSTGFRNSYTYTGREWDPETGLYYYRARYYDPMEGRFIQKDPISFAGGDMNLYGYVQEDPINNTDPLGLAKYHGNWCGPDWTGGRKESYTLGHIYDDPIDSLDNCCRDHDVCYYECRQKWSCDLIRRDLCMTECDRKLATCAASNGHKYSSPLWWWMNFNTTPMVGPDAKK